MFIAFALALLIIRVTSIDQNLFHDRWSILAGIVIMFIVGIIDDY